nr:MAG TPA: hypothetical protein [Bacteriophage sp.]
MNDLVYSWSLDKVFTLSYPIRIESKTLLVL